MGRWVSHQLAGAAALFAAGAVVVGWPLGPFVAGMDHPLLNLAVPVVLAIQASIVARADPGNPIGMLLAIVAVVAGMWALADRWSATDLPGVGWALWLASWGWMPGLLVPHSVVLLLFPDGRPPSPRWRPIMVALTAVVVGCIAASALYPAAYEAVPGRPGNPLQIPVSPETYSSWLVPLLAGAQVAVVIAIVSLVWRWRRADRVVRRQLAWPLLGTLVALGLALTPYTWGLLPLVPLVVPTAVVAAIRWRGLYGVDRVLSRSLVYIISSFLVFALLVGVLAGSGSLVGEAGGGLLTAVVVTAVIAAGFDPLRRRLQRLVDRAVYGRSGDPAAAVSRLGSRLVEMPTPAEVPNTIVEVIAESLGVNRVAILARIDGVMRTLACHGGVPTEVALSAPLVGADGVVGRLLVGTRDVGEPLTRSDRRMVEELARHAGSAVHASLLAAEVRQARTALVLARDEERQRLRRDLHDGLGSYLAGIGFALAGVRRQVTEPQATMLARVADQAAGATREVRRILDGLRPGPLEQLGLLDALRDLADRGAGTATPLVTVTCPPSLPPVPLLVELAAYQITSEALTNVIRHAKATQCELSVSVTPTRLCLAVTDDGVGLPPQAHYGVGLESMRVRAETVGGVLAVRRRSGGGTVVSVELPWEVAA
jgi:signal transduction histidine kinase